MEYNLDTFIYRDINNNNNNQNNKLINYKNYNSYSNNCYDNNKV